MSRHSPEQCPQMPQQIQVIGLWVVIWHFVAKDASNFSIESSQSSWGDNGEDEVLLDIWDRTQFWPIQTVEHYIWETKMKTSPSDHSPQIVFICSLGNSKEPPNFTAVSDAAVGYIYFCCIHKHNPRTHSYVIKNSRTPKWADFVDFDMDKWRSQRVQLTTSDIFYHIILMIFLPILFKYTPEFIEQDILFPTLINFCDVRVC
jgi:hypothetical protein